MTDEPCTISYDPTTHAIVINQLRLTDSAMIAEARHWSTGRRGPAVDDAALAAADLTSFVNQALLVGVQAIAVASSSTDKLELQHLLDDFTTRTHQTARAATESTQQVVQESTEVMTRTAADVKEQLEAAQKGAAEEFRTGVRCAEQGLRDEVTRLFGGDSPVLLERLTPLLDRFGQQLAQRGGEQTQALIDRAGRLFDADDPTSPMAKHAKTLDERNRELRVEMAEHHRDTTERLTRLATAIEAATAAKTARRQAEQASALKGATYEDAVHAVMEPIAVGLGDEYLPIGALPSKRSRSKKGDGLLRIAGTGVKVVVEMTDSTRRDWTGYLQEAESMREAQASLGLVPSPEHLGGDSIRCLGPRRVVLAFDPATDDPQLLRTVVQLLRLAAQAAGGRSNREGIATAEEKISEAIGALSTLLDLQRVASDVKRSGEKIMNQAGDLQTKLQCLLEAARSALSSAAQEAAAA